ncbi:MAG: hypothetical protein ACRDTG_21540 [Pseudonocardiaceae bacterium]
MTWFVASLRDEDTHLGEDSSGPAVTARCGRSFRPLVALAGAPPDPLQVCPTCAQSQQVTPRTHKR